MTDAGWARGGGRRVEPAIVLLALVLGAGLAAYRLDGRSLWLDEGASWAIASQHGAALWRAIRHDGGNMLAYYLLLHVLIGAFGDGIWVLRMPSVVADGATAALVALLALRVVDSRRMALGAGVLAAVSLPLVFWGQDARGYALMVTFVVGSYLAFVRRAPVAYAVATLLAIYCGFVAALIVPAQLLVLAFDRWRARSILAAVAAVAAGCVPLAVLASGRGSSQLFWVPSPSLAVLGQAARTLTSAGMPPNFHATATSTVTLALTGVVLLAALAARPPGVLVAWLAVPVVLALAVAVAGEPVELARGSVIVLPAVALLLAWPLSHERVPAAAGWAVVAAVVALRALQLAPSYGVSPEPWRAAARYVLSARPAAACLVFYPQDGQMPFRYYARPRRAVRPSVERYTVPSASRLQATARRCPTAWLVSSHEGQRDGPPASRRNYARYLRLRSALEHAYRQRRELDFGWAAVIHVIRLRR